MNQTNPTPIELEKLLMDRLNIPPEAQKDFLFPPYAPSDPFLFEGMERAIERIKKAIDTGECIGIYADYDCDGIPAAVILLDLFKKIGYADKVHHYIPDRHDEGYGLSTQGIDSLINMGVSLIITVDVGITALAEVADAQSRNIDVIVTDHHQMLEILPSAFAVIHPVNGEYPNKDLCGAGVAFMLIRAFLQKYGNEYSVPEGWERTLLDLVGFATLSDMVSLIGENRSLAACGLIIMRMSKRIGLRVLFAANMIDQRNIIEQDLTFTVAPRLNAASRMKTPMLAFELLSTEDIARAKEIVAELTLINDERKKLVARIVKEAHARLAARELPDIVVIGDLLWRPAVLGLVANKLQEHYRKSFLVWGEAGDGTLKGSCRMLSVHHAAKLFQALPEDALLHGGGHKAAGGFAATKNQIHFLEERINTVSVSLGEDGGEEVQIGTIDVPLSIATNRHYEVVRKFAPFGTGNPEPLFQFTDIEVLSSKKFGKTKEHIECQIQDGTGKATAFMFFADEATVQTLAAGNRVRIVATIEPGYRFGVRLKIKEVKLTP